MNNEARAQKNFNLTTVGGLCMMLGVSCASIGIWLIVTGDHLPGALLTVGAAVMLYTAYMAFSRVRPGPPEWRGYEKK